MTDTEEAPLIRTGGCQCGACRYRITGPIQDLYCCHCAECRGQSSSAFGISAIVAVADFELTAGAPKRWRRPTSSGAGMDCCFCPDCGARLWHQSRDDPGSISVKGGTLDTPPDLTRAKHIWVSRKLEGVILPSGVETWPEEPPR